MLKASQMDTVRNRQVVWMFLCQDHRPSLQRTSDRFMIFTGFESFMLGIDRWPYLLVVLGGSMRWCLPSKWGTEGTWEGSRDKNWTDWTGLASMDHYHTGKTQPLQFFSMLVWRNMCSTPCAFSFHFFGRFVALQPSIVSQTACIEAWCQASAWERCQQIFSSVTSLSSGNAIWDGSLFCSKDGWYTWVYIYMVSKL